MFPETRFGPVWVPVAKVHVLGRDGSWWGLRTFVDSGALVTLVQWQFGEHLGLAPASGEPVDLSGVKKGAPVMGHLHTVRMRLGDVEFPSRIVVAIDDSVPNLLGRLDVFDRFDVSLSAADRTTTFRAR